MNLRKYFKNAYGLDDYSKFLLIIGVVFLLVKRASLGGLFIVGYVGWRTLSNNKYKRAQENTMFQVWKKKVQAYFYRLTQKLGTNKKRFIDNRKYAIVSCPKCSAKLRLPKRKGNMIVTCKLCHTEFKTKT